MKQANSSGAAYALIIGENELAHNTVSVRDLQAESMETEKKQVEMPQENLVRFLN
jgi:histidyl-tRNA synthetase